VALTDHDTTGGLAEAARAAERYPDLVFVPGIEVSVRPQRGTTHVLGLGIDGECPAVTRIAAFYQNARRQRNPRIVGRLNELGVELSMDDVLAAAGADSDEHRILGRPHIAEALRRAGHVASVTEAFEKYLARAAPAYVERDRLTAREAIEAIHAAGGLAVAAHPGQWQCANSAQVEKILRDMISAGIDGVEAYHSDHDPSLTRLLIDLARRLNLALTGGSDYHALTGSGVQLGHPRVPLAAVRGARTERMLAGV
jgi:hypothetical protein